MKLFRNCAVDIVYDSSASTWNTSSLGGLVGYVSLNADVVYQVENVGAKLELIGGGGAFSYVGLFGDLGQWSSGGGFTIDQWYMQLLAKTTTFRYNVGGLMGDFYGSGSLNVGAGYLALEYPAGLEDSKDVRIVSGAGDFDVPNVFVDTTLLPEAIDATISFKRSTTELMFQEETFVGWDFVNLWMIAENVDYPRFIFMSGELPNILFVTYKKYFPAGDPNLIPQEFRGGTIRKYRVVDLEEYPTVKDITEEVELEFAPIEEAELPADEQVILDPITRTIRGMHAGILNLTMTYKGKKVKQEMEVYGPDYFELSESLQNPFVVNVPKKISAKAVYRDGFIEVLKDATKYWKEVNPDTFVIKKQTLKALQEGEHPIKISHLGITEEHLITVEALPLPELVNTVNTSATLYAVFQMPVEMAIDTYFSVRAFADEAKAEEIVTRTTIDHMDSFTQTIDGGGTWNLIAQNALSPSGKDSEMFCARLPVGPRNKVYLDFGVLTGEETEDIYAPVISISPPPGTYNHPVEVDISLDEPGYIFFGTDGVNADIPYESSGDLTLYDSCSLVIEAVDENGAISKAIVYDYVIDMIAPAVYADIASGVYFETQRVTLSASEPDVTIYYTTDGEMPTTDSSIYTMPVEITLGTTTLRAFAIDRAGNIGEVMEVTYTVKEMPAGGSFGKPVIITELDTVSVADHEGLYGSIYFRYDDFIIDAEYTVEVIEPAHTNGGVTIYDSNQAGIAGGQIGTTIKFTATTKNMFMYVDMGPTSWNPVKVKLSLVTGDTT